jgi:hypothetical protein
MKRKVVSTVLFLLISGLLTLAPACFAEDKKIEITSVDNEGVISIYPDSFPVKRDIKGKVKGFSKEEIADLGLVVDVLVLDVSQGPVPVEKNGKWVVKATLKDADLVIKAIAKDKSGKELASTQIKATASGEF